MHLGTIVGIVLAILLVAAIILAGIYINGHPNSNAALFFIEVSVPYGLSSAIRFCIRDSQAIRYPPLLSSLTHNMPEKPTPAPSWHISQWLVPFVPITPRVQHLGSLSLWNSPSAFVSPFVKLGKSPEERLKAKTTL